MVFSIFRHERRTTLYFRLSLIWLAALVAGFGYLLLSPAQRASHSSGPSTTAVNSAESSKEMAPSFNCSIVMMPTSLF